MTEGKGPRTNAKKRDETMSGGSKLHAKALLTFREQPKRRKIIEEREKEMKHGLHKVRYQRWASETKGGVTLFKRTQAGKGMTWGQQGGGGVGGNYRTKNRGKSKIHKHPRRSVSLGEGKRNGRAFNEGKDGTQTNGKGGGEKKTLLRGIMVHKVGLFHKSAKHDKKKS